MTSVHQEDWTEHAVGSNMYRSIWDCQLRIQNISINALPEFFTFYLLT